MADYVEILRQSELDKLESVPAKLLAILQGIDNINKTPVTPKGLNEALSALNKYQAESQAVYAQVTESQQKASLAIQRLAKANKDNADAALKNAKAQEVQRKTTEANTKADNSSVEAKRRKAEADRKAGDELLRQRIVINNETQATNSNTAATNQNTASNRKSREEVLASIAAWDAKRAAERAATGATVENTTATTANNAALNVTASPTGSVASATKGFKGLWSVIRQAAYILPGVGISGLLMIVPTVIMAIIDAARESKSLADALDKVKLAAKSMMEALGSSEVQDAVKNVIELRQNIKLAKEGILDKNKVLHQYNETIGKTTGEVDSLNGAEQALIKNADAYVKVTLYKTAANLAATEAAKKLLDAEKNRRKADAEFQNTIIDNPSSGTYGGMGGYTPGPDQNTDATRAAAAKRRKEEAIKRATDESNAQLSIAEKFQRDAASLAQKSGFDFFSGTQTEKGKKERVRRETDTVNEIVEARRKLTDSQRDLALTEQNIIIEKNKTIFEDERRSNDERASAYAEIQDARLQINQLNFEKEISDVITWEAQYNGEVQKALATDEKLRTEHQKRILIDAETNKNNRLRIESQFNYANVKILEEGARYINETYNNIDKSVKDSVDKTINEAGARLQKYMSARQKQQSRDYKEEERRLKEHVDLMQSLSQSVLDAASGVSGGLNQRRLDALDLENEKIQKNLQDELDAIQLSGDSEVEKQKKIADAEGRAAAQSKAIADEQRRQKTEQAKQDKAITIANIILKTALAVVTALTEGDPFTKIPRAIAAGALGASQLAVAIATPIPQYAKGTDFHPGGLAWEGDGGEKELNIEPSGKMYWSPDTATLMKPARGTQVIPEHVLMESILNGQSSLNGGSLATSKDNAYLAEIAKGNKRIENAIKSQEILSVNIDRYGFDVSSQRGNSWVKYENSRIHR